MDPRTLELMRHLQSESHDAATLDAIRELLPEVRAVLDAAGDAATLTDLRGLIEAWATAAGPVLRADALVLASGLVEGAERARLLRAVGQLRLEQARDVDGAIAVYEEALDEDADVALTRELADLYALRAGDGDPGRAADLYAMLGELVEGSERVTLVEKALDLAPGHTEALTLLEADIPQAERTTRLRARWEAFVSVTSDEAGAALRRIELARADGAQERYRDALLWLAPLVDRGDPTAQRLKEAFLANLEGVSPKPADAATTPAAERPLPARGLSPRSGQTMVGFKVPGGLASDATLEAVENARRALVAQEEAAAQAVGAQPVQVTQREIAARTPAATAAATPAAPAAFAATMLGLPQAAKAEAPAPVVTARVAPEPSPAMAATMLGLPHAVTSAAEVNATGATQAAMETPPGASWPPIAPRVSVTPPRSSKASVAPRASAASAAVAPTPKDAPATASVPPRDPFASAPPAAPRSSAPLVFDTLSKAADPFGDEDAFAARRGMSMPDKRWLIAGGVVAVGILLAVIPWGGGDAPVAPDTRSSSVPAPSSPTPAPTPTPAATPVAPPPAAPAPTVNVAAAPTAAPSPTPTPSTGRASASSAGGAKRARASGSVTLVTKVARVRGGKLTTKQVASALGSRLTAFERCYADALERETRLSGRLVLEWTVRAKGRASGVKKLQSTIHDSRLYQCEAAAIGQTKFADPGRSSSVVRMGFEHARK